MNRARTTSPSTSKSSSKCASVVGAAMKVFDSCINAMMPTRMAIPPLAEITRGVQTDRRLRVRLTLHPLDRVDAEQLQGLLQDARRQVAQQQPALPEGVRVGLDDGAVLEE